MAYKKIKKSLVKNRIFFVFKEAYIIFMTFSPVCFYPPNSGYACLANYKVDFFFSFLIKLVEKQKDLLNYWAVILCLTDCLCVCVSVCGREDWISLNKSPSLFKKKRTVFYYLFWSYYLLDKLRKEIF